MMLTDNRQHVVEANMGLVGKVIKDKVHGLGHEDTDDADVFPFVWRRMEKELLEDVVILSEDTDGQDNAVPLVAHNACFDGRCLREVFGCYRMDYPEFVFHDTLTASRLHFGDRLENHQLQTVAAACGYDLMNHHHALADAEACAWIAREIL